MLKHADMVELKENLSESTFACLEKVLVTDEKTNREIDRCVEENWAQIENAIKEKM